MKVILAFLLLFIQSGLGSLNLFQQTSPSVPESRKRDLVISNIVGKPVKFRVSDNVQSVVVDGQTVLSSNVNINSNRRSLEESNQDLLGQINTSNLDDDDDNQDEPEEQEIVSDDGSLRCALNAAMSPWETEDTCPASMSHDFLIEVSRTEFCEDSEKIEGDVNEIDHLIGDLEEAKKMDVPQIDLASLDAVLYYLQALSHFKHRFDCFAQEDENDSARKLSFDMNKKIRPSNFRRASSSSNQVTNHIVVRSFHRKQLRKSHIVSKQSAFENTKRLSPSVRLSQESDKRKLTLEAVMDPKKRLALVPIFRKMRAEDLAKLDKKLAMQMRAKTKRQISLSRRIMLLHNQNLINYAKRLRDLRRNRRNLKIDQNSHTKQSAELNNRIKQIRSRRQNQYLHAARGSLRHRRMESLRRTSQVSSKLQSHQAPTDHSFVTSMHQIRKYL